MLKGRKEEAKHSISRILALPIDSPELQAEADNMQVSIEHELSQTHGSSYIDCFRSSEDHVRLRVLTGMALQALQQLTGINFVRSLSKAFKGHATHFTPFHRSSTTALNSLRAPVLLASQLPLLPMLSTSS